jgi:hypothetical protein
MFLFLFYFIEENFVYILIYNLGDRTDYLGIRNALILPVEKGFFEFKNAQISKNQV